MIHRLANIVIYFVEKHYDFSFILLKSNFFQIL